MNEAEERRVALVRQRRKEIAGLVAMISGGIGVAIFLIFELGLSGLGIVLGIATMFGGWYFASSPASPGTLPGLELELVEVDPENPDPGQFLPQFEAYRESRDPQP